MTDEKEINHDTGSNTAVAGNESKGNDEHRDSPKSRSKQGNHKILVRTPKGSRPQTAKSDPEPRRNEEDRIVKFEMGATINTGQYENIQPKIEIATNNLERGTKIAMDYIADLSKRFSINGALKEKATITAKLTSYNEPSVEADFDPIAHTYTYKGSRLIGATTLISRYYKKFDAAAIAKVCATSWGVPQQNIEDMWNSNGDIAGELGTLVHKALEHYSRYNEMGLKISAKNGKENPAMPKHPLLRTLIEGFHKLENTPQGTVIPEVFLTDVAQGYCGQADRLLITGEKTCRIQDFKVNIDSDKEDKNSKALAPYNVLPATKLTKYQLQMSIYANMMQKSGWTVEGLDAFVFEDGWKHYVLPVLTVI